jgi:hypothetical protein
MDYVLIIILQFQQYKNNMKLELFSDDLFIDQLVLDKSVPLQKEIWTPQDYNDSFKLISKNYPMHFHKTPDNVSEYCPCPDRIFFYQLNESCLGDKLTIKLNDTNTNYTNGFMTKSNLIKFERIFLVPKKILELESMQSLLERYPKIFQKIAHKYFTRDVIDYTILWPGNKRFSPPIMGDSEELTMAECDIWHGGVKSLHLPIVKKHGVHMIDINRFVRPSNLSKKIAIDQNFWHYMTYYKLINISNEDQ